MIPTRGLTHVAVAVRDPQRTAAFYRAVFGCEVVYERPEFVQLQTPGARDVLVFERDPEHAGRAGGIKHFGFRLLSPSDIERAADAVRAAGGRIHSQGEFCPGEPYLFFEDPDGYEIEVWFEIPTAVDPPG